MRETYQVKPVKRTENFKITKTTKIEVMYLKVGNKMAEAMMKFIIHWRVCSNFPLQAFGVCGVCTWCTLCLGIGVVTILWSITRTTHLATKPTKP